MADVHLALGQMQIHSWRLSPGEINPNMGGGRVRTRLNARGIGGFIMRLKHWYHHGWQRRPAFAHSHNTQSNTHCESRLHGHGGGRGDFGVRRPLRYLRYQLDLDDGQTRRVAAILNRLKLEREQAQIDDKRCLQTLADRVESGETDRAGLRTVLDERVRSAERMQQEVASSIAEVCDCLDADQRERFADLMRSGAIQW